MDADFLPLLYTVMSILGVGFGIVFVILNYQYQRKVNNMTLTQHKEQELTENLEMKLRQKLADSVREDIRGYVDREINYLKRELASAISLTDKDIGFLRRNYEDMKLSVDRLNQVYWGTNTKSEPAYLRGEMETREHDAAEGEGIFKDTEEEKAERESQ